MPSLDAYESLPKRRKDFVDAYIGKANGNAAEAARLAGYSKKSAAVIACRLMREPDVQAGMTARLNELAMGAEEVVARLTQQARNVHTAFIKLRSDYYRRCPTCFGDKQVPDYPAPEEGEEEPKKGKKREPLWYDPCERCNRTGHICVECGRASDQCDGLPHRGPVTAYLDLQGLQDAGLMHLVKSIKNTREGQNIEFHDATHALELLGRRHKLFTDQYELAGSGGGPLVVKVLQGVSMEDL